MATILAGRPPIKIGGEWRPQGKGPHTDVEVRVAYSLFHGDTLSFFLSGVRLTQMTVFLRDADCLLMLKGTRRKKKLIAFLDAPTLRDAWALGATCLDSGHVPWKEEVPLPKG